MQPDLLAENQETVKKHISYWKSVWKQFSHHSLGVFALALVILFCLVGVYAPFLASSKPLAVHYDGEWYFPLFRYLFYRGFFTKGLDIFFNLLMFTLPLMIASFFLPRKFRWPCLLGLCVFQLLAFLYFAFGTPHDPASDKMLNKEREKAMQQRLMDNKDPKKTPISIPMRGWDFELKHMNDYAKLNLILRYQERKWQQEKLLQYPQIAAINPKELPTLWQMDRNHEERQRAQLTDYLQNNLEAYQKQKAIIIKDSTIGKPLSVEEEKTFLQARQFVLTYEDAQARLKLLQDQQRWLEIESGKISFVLMPLLRPFHWQEDAGGKQSFNQKLPWWELTRINRKDLVAGLIFGIRISLMVGIVSVTLALLIGIPIGSLAGYYGGTFDIIVSRLLEIWESMPTFFMLLLVVAMTQSKSIFLVIIVIGVFGWTGFSRFTRGEFFKQRNLPYVEACHAQGFHDRYVMFSHILPNAIPPILTLMPFAIMGAITSEAGLSFLGLGEEGSCSWGVLMDEGRNAFPGESYLLWPPAILLTILLVAIAIVGDALRDALDPKMHVRVKE